MWVVNIQNTRYGYIAVIIIAVIIIAVIIIALIINNNNNINNKIIIILFCESITSFENNNQDLSMVS